MSKLNLGIKAFGILLLWAGTAVALPAQTTADAPDASTLTTLHSFDLLDGAGPNALVQATDGNLYGTTATGGDLGRFCYFRDQNNGCGTVFKITPGGALTTLYKLSVVIRGSGLTQTYEIQRNRHIKELRS